MGEVPEVWQWEAIKLSLKVEQTEVADRAEESVRFWSEVEGRDVSIRFRWIYFFHYTKSNQLIPCLLGQLGFWGSRKQLSDLGLNWRPICMNSVYDISIGRLCIKVLL